MKAGAVRITDNGNYSIYWGRNRGWQNKSVETITIVTMDDKKVRDAQQVPISEYTPEAVMSILENCDPKEIGVYSEIAGHTLGNYFPLNKLNQEELKKSLLFNAPQPPAFSIRV